MSATAAYELPRPLTSVNSSDSISPQTEITRADTDALHVIPNPQFQISILSSQVTQYYIPIPQHRQRANNGTREKHPAKHAERRNPFPTTGFTSLTRINNTPHDQQAKAKDAHSPKTNTQMHARTRAAQASYTACTVPVPYMHACIQSCT